MSPAPDPGRVVQDPRGERWVVIYRDRGKVTLTATRENPRYAQPDPTVVVTREQWNGLFREGWLAL